ncbi:MAG: folate-binding protein [Rhodomicrobium sp.]
MTAKATVLSDRSVIEVAGEDRASFLQGLITNEAEGLAEGAACFAALLSPQGKILFDFLVFNTGEAFLLDCVRTAAPDLMKRLGFYKLRAKVTLSDVSGRWRIAAAWGDEAGRLTSASASMSYRDPRLADLGFRAFLTESEAEGFPAGIARYHQMRIELAVPEGGKDYAYGDTFPHDACLDLLHGVNFKKGCYVGQEVVSRMEHRGTARTRVLAVSGEQSLPEGGADILADGFPVGRLGSVAGNRGIALGRLDRVRDALNSGQSLIAGGVPVTVSVPVWANYTLDAAKA